MKYFADAVRAMVEGARAAGAGLRARQALLGEITVRSKSGPADLVSVADEEAERTVQQHLSQARPDYAFLGEEGGAVGGGERQWIVDPLDGTTNFLFGGPLWGVNVALADRGRVVAGVTYLPVLDELYVAEAGRGAWLGDRRLRVSSRATLGECVLSCGIPFHGKPDHDIFVREMARLSARTSGLRRTGACSVDFAFVAAGRWDAYWERALCAWDMAPGVILVQEAGGMVTGVDGGPLALDGGHVFASNGAVHAALLDQLERARRGETD